MAGLARAGFVLLLTPSGSLPSSSRRWHWWARALGAAPVAFLVTVALLPEPLDPTYESIANPLGLPGGLPVQVPLLVVNLLAGAVVLLTVPIAAVSVAVRFRLARGLERQQLRWLAFAAGLAPVSARLRDQVDLDTLTGDLPAVVDQTMQPTPASLWLRPQGAAAPTDQTAARQVLRRNLNGIQSHGPLQWEVRPDGDVAAPAGMAAGLVGPVNPTAASGRVKVSMSIR
jgi:hypothetical protein